jgi:hypothetical protein
MSKGCPYCGYISSVSIQQCPFCYQQIPSELSLKDINKKLSELSYKQFPNNYFVLIIVLLIGIISTLGVASLIHPISNWWDLSILIYFLVMGILGIISLILLLLKLKIGYYFTILTSIIALGGFGIGTIIAIFVMILLFSSDMQFLFRYGTYPAHHLLGPPQISQQISQMSPGGPFSTFSHNYYLIGTTLVFCLSLIISLISGFVGTWWTYSEWGITYRAHSNYDYISGFVGGFIFFSIMILPICAGLKERQRSKSSFDFQHPGFIYSTVSTIVVLIIIISQSTSMGDIFIGIGPSILLSLLFYFIFGGEVFTILMVKWYSQSYWFPYKIEKFLNKQQSQVKFISLMEIAKDIDELPSLVGNIFSKSAHKIKCGGYYNPIKRIYFFDPSHDTRIEERPPTPAAPMPSYSVSAQSPNSHPQPQMPPLSAPAQQSDVPPNPQMSSLPVQQPIQILQSTHEIQKEKNEIEIKTAHNYEKAYVVYKVKIENQSTSPIAKIKVKIYALTDVFIMDKEEEEISLLEPDNAQTVSFRLRPRGECGDVHIKGKVTYYEMNKRQNIEKEIPSRLVTIICPLLKSTPISEDDWERITSTLIMIEETTEEILIGGKALMEMLFDTIREMNFYPLKSKINETETFYRAKMRFYSKGPGELHYALSLEVIGGYNKSKLIIKNYANTEEALTGCYHKILDEIEKRVKIKQYLSEGTIHVHGDYIRGDKKDVTIKDSVVMRSNIGNDSTVFESKVGHEISSEDEKKQEIPTVVVASGSQEFACSKCGKKLKPSWTSCPYCGLEYK